MFFNKKVQLLVSELYIYQNAQCNNKKIANIITQNINITIPVIHIIVTEDVYS